ncbi:MAG: phosphoribosylanthranilate isomerase, partial [Lachnospiraceae bacterium]|nr:phosphoribosylanthranilate isomerase [Lachnospiraceae bacterium]
MQIKICGITTRDDISYVNEAGPDFAGFIQFFPKSKRNISVGQAKELFAGLSPNIKKVAVTVEPTPEQIKEIEAAGFDYIQIHGNMDVRTLAQIKIPALKAFNVKDLGDFETYNACENVKGFVFDASVPGQGKTFDWSLLQGLPEISDDRIVLLAGGLNPENVADAIRATGARGVDTSSGVENDNGVGKSRKKILAFVEN